MSTPSDWVKMSDRHPTEQDLPVEYYDAKKRDDMPRWINHTGLSSCEATHWRHHESVPPPPAEPTQREKDKEAFDIWYQALMDLYTPGTGYTWHAALAYERAEVSALLAGWRVSNQGVCSEMLAAIEARCQKQA